MSVNLSTINKSVKAASYAVRGAIVARSMELSKQLQQENSSLPFNKIISCNIGNPLALDQKALSFIRDVLSVVVNPSLTTRVTFPEDVLSRSKKYLDSIPDIGAYTESQGILAVREEVCEFLNERDGYAANPSDIFLTNGASEGVRLCMQTILRPSTENFKGDGILTPIPQYPLYSALTTLLQGNLIPYYLDESRGWECSIASLSESLAQARSQGITPKALVVINPGNPTGHVQSDSGIRAIIDWCRSENILLMADEVYQENIWKDHAKFVSFRKVAYDTNAFAPGDNCLQLISFHSISKGFLGECGLRGGYFELLGIPADVKQEIYKLCSISLCSNTIGQIATGCMVQPPKPGHVSYDIYEAEKSAILTSMKNRAVKMTDALNKLPGVSCNAIDGAMYAFPTITLPEKAILEAKVRGVAPDEMYCLELLEHTGIMVVPGSGFGQAEGTYHFRTTILPPEDKLDEVIELMTAYHSKFIENFS